MHAFVDTMLRQIAAARDDADVESLLGHLAEHLGYRSGYLLNFPNDPAQPIRLWDSDKVRAAWWREYTDNGTHSLSKSFADILADGGVQHIEIAPGDPRYDFATTYDFVDATIVPIVFATDTRGIVSLSGKPGHATDIELSLQIVCYALLMQARAIGIPPRLAAVSLTPREREVVALSADGMTSDMVASRLGISPRTAIQHMDNVATKLKTRNRVHTVAEAIRLRLLS